MSKLALITGASSGFGVEFAKILAAKKIDLIITARSIDKLNKLKDEIETTYSVKVEAYQSDLGKIEEAHKLCSDLKDRNVDILINNAGVGLYGEFIETSLDAEVNMMNLNMQSLVILSKCFGKKMSSNKSGKILNIASTAAFQPGPLMAIYYATKAFVLNFSEALTEELRSHGVSVTCYCPGATRTGFESAASAGNSELFRGNLPTAREVAEDAIRAMDNKRMTKIHGLMNFLMAFSIRFSPRFMVPKVVAFVQRKTS